MLKEELKAMMQADVDNIDIHIDFDNSAVAKVNIKLKGILETFEYNYEDTSVHNMKINKLDAQLKELGSALVNKINKMAQAHGLIGSYKDWLKDDLTVIKDFEVLLNEKVVGRCIDIRSTNEIDGAKKLELNYIKMESFYKWELSDNPIRIFITDKYGEVIKYISGYLINIEEYDNNIVVIAIEQELI